MGNCVEPLIDPQQDLDHRLGDDLVVLAVEQPHPIIGKVVDGIDRAPTRRGTDEIERILDLGVRGTQTEEAAAVVMRASSHRRRDAIQRHGPQHRPGIGDVLEAAIRPACDDSSPVHELGVGDMELVRKEAARGQAGDGDAAAVEVRNRLKPPGRRRGRWSGHVIMGGIARLRACQRPIIAGLLRSYGSPEAIVQARSEPASARDPGASAPDHRAG